MSNSTEDTDGAVSVALQTHVALDVQHGFTSARRPNVVSNPTAGSKVEVFIDRAGNVEGNLGFWSRFSGKVIASRDDGRLWCVERGIATEGGLEKGELPSRWDIEEEVDLTKLSSLSDVVVVSLIDLVISESSGE